MFCFFRYWDGDDSRNHICFSYFFCVFSRCGERLYKNTGNYSILTYTMPHANKIFLAPLCDEQDFPRRSATTRRAKQVSNHTKERLGLPHKATPHNRTIADRDYAQDRYKVARAHLEMIPSTIARTPKTNLKLSQRKSNIAANVRFQVTWSAS